MPVKATLLLIEDSDTQGSQLKTSLENLGYEVKWAKSGMQGLTIARSSAPDLIVLDVIMDDMDGFAVCRWLKMHGSTRDIPVIMLTQRGELKDRVEGLHVGADDYLPKPFAPEELEARIFAALRIQASQTELKRRNSQLESMLHHVEALAITDPLTGLYNRRRLSDVLRREWAVAKRYKNDLSCIMVDIDHFKGFNDRYGHDAGDAILKEVARTLGEGLREVDLAARYGGEEFAILLPQTNKPGAVTVASRLHKSLHARRVRIGEEELRVTASFGVAADRDIADGGAEDLIRAADAALYDAKRNGRDRVVAFDPGAHGMQAPKGSED
jgi:two-component system, cell cycle response regulator